jgi:hypothetical protein
MSTSTSVPHTVHRGRSHRLIILAALAALIGAIAWAAATYVEGSGSSPANHGSPTQASAPSSLTPQQWRYVFGIAALSQSQQAAAFGTAPPSPRLSGRQVEELSQLQHAAEQLGLHPGVFGPTSHD